MSDDRFSTEWDPSQYEPEPDLSGGYRRPRTELSDRVNAWIFYATEEFHRNMAEHEVSIHRELTSAEKFRHIRRFEAQLSRQYGACRPDGGWLSRHEGWQARNGGGG